MISNSLHAIWVVMAPALGNHLWQSTVFAMVVALLTLVLRHNRAAVRYSLWLAASVKFLVPFSLLAGLGSLLASPHSSVGRNRTLNFAVEVSQPFSAVTVPDVSHFTQPTALQRMADMLPFLLILWVCGTLVVAVMWAKRWRRTAAVLEQRLCVKAAKWTHCVERSESQA